jgi:hypothetical protein
VKTIIYIFALSVLINTLGGCAFGGKTEEGLAEGGKIEIPVTVHKWEGTPMGTVCCTNAGACVPGGAGPMGTPCYCNSYYGPIYGQVCR